LILSHFLLSVKLIVGLLPDLPLPRVLSCGFADCRAVTTKAEIYGRSRLSFRCAVVRGTSYQWRLFGQ
jgi:hypothetical protein